MCGCTAVPEDGRTCLVFLRLRLWAGGLKITTVTQQQQQYQLVNHFAVFCVRRDIEC